MSSLHNEYREKQAENLQEELDILEKQFDIYYSKSDDHKFFMQQSKIHDEIHNIKSKIEDLYNEN